MPSEKTLRLPVRRSKIGRKRRVRARQFPWEELDMLIRFDTLQEVTIPRLNGGEGAVSAHSIRCTGGEDLVLFTVVPEQ